ncbi:DUF2470 domain-containing protein [Microcella alkaliphila]|uniref:DUF2470 domain-containing protein n=1 Tax=Microcella alkaliphila TaxID=279828 RepID=UPI001029F7C7|nr:DUF2470 domain-containing protein [Microcella alkaliphila]
MTRFPDEIVHAVLHHMNDDHADDSLLIARAFGDRGATDSRMIDVTPDAGHWVYSLGDDLGERALSVRWSRTISERPEIRHEIVALYDRACTILGETPRPH